MAHVYSWPTSKLFCASLALTPSSRRAFRYFLGSNVQQKSFPTRSKGPFMLRRDLNLHHFWWSVISFSTCARKRLNLLWKAAFFRTSSARSIFSLHLEMKYRMIAPLLTLSLLESARSHLSVSMERNTVRSTRNADSLFFAKERISSASLVVILRFLKFARLFSLFLCWRQYSKNSLIWQFGEKRKKPRMAGLFFDRSDKNSAYESSFSQMQALCSCTDGCVYFHGEIEGSEL